MQSEDEQQSMFYESQQAEFFNQVLMEEEFPEHSQPFDYVGHYKQINDKPEESNLFQQWGFITQQQKKNFEKFQQHNKYVTGIQGMITLNRRQKGATNQEGELELGRFFDQEAVQPNQIFEKRLVQLSKMFTRIDYNLVENFENFNYIQKANDNQFIQKCKLDYLNKLKNLGKKKNPVELFDDLFSWWLDGFRSMMLQIQKCSPLYTLNIFKKQKDNPFVMMVELGPKQSKELQQQPKQRRLWTKNQLELLNQFMDNNTTLSSHKIQQVANELGRSSVAVQSKIQKLQKEKKDKPNDLSLQKKMLIVLANDPSGLSKQQLLNKMEAQFQMGDEDTWKKSVSQLLSVSKKVVKSKGVFSFTCHPSLQPPTNFKNKVISCLYQLPQQKGNLKSITKKYVQKFFALDGLNPEDCERIKLIQASIYKTIFKYDIFDKSNSKLVYKYVQNELSNRDSQSDRSQSGSKDYQL